MNLIAHLHSHLPRELVLDLQDAMSAKALQAYEMVRDHAELDGKRARALTGQARFRMQEKAFQEVCSTFGGEPLENDVIPGTDLLIFDFKLFEQLRFALPVAIDFLLLFTLERPYAFLQKVDVI